MEVPLKFSVLVPERNAGVNIVLEALIGLIKERIAPFARLHQGKRLLPDGLILHIFFDHRLWNESKQVFPVRNGVGKLLPLNQIVHDQLDGVEAAPGDIEIASSKADVDLEELVLPVPLIVLQIEV